MGAGKKRRLGLVLLLIAGGGYLAYLLSLPEDTVFVINDSAVKYMMVKRFAAGELSPEIVLKDDQVVRRLWQDGFYPRRAPGFVEAMRLALADYAAFGGVGRIDWGGDSAAKRLFGVRPKRA